MIVAIMASVLGLLGRASGEPGLHEVDAQVVQGQPCAGSSPMEVIRFSVDGQERTGHLDGCGHQPEEILRVRVGAGDEIGHAAEAAAGQGRYGQRLGEVLLVLAGVAAAGYGLLLRRGRRGTPLPLLGPLVPGAGERRGAVNP